MCIRDSQQTVKDLYSRCDTNFCRLLDYHSTQLHVQLDLSSTPRSTHSSFVVIVAKLSNHQQVRRTPWEPCTCRSFRYAITGSLKSTSRFTSSSSCKLLAHFTHASSSYSSSRHSSLLRFFSTPMQSLVGKISETDKFSAWSGTAKDKIWWYFVAVQSFFNVLFGVLERGFYG